MNACSVHCKAVVLHLNFISVSLFNKIKSCMKGQFVRSHSIFSNEMKKVSRV